MNWIFVHIEESGGSIATVQLSSVSMIGKSDEGGSTIFFNNPDNRLRVIDEFEDLINQIAEIDINIAERMRKLGG